ncbi:MAG: hypothetical protein LBR26_03010 [Prevotella sp.]|jgi:hypothetical protein|nr:hypothetical protein [Prevotella sp.]
MKDNKPTPLQQLRQEKAIARRECAESEERLAAHWSYLSDNAGSLLFRSAINAALRQFGFGPKEDAKDSGSDGMAYSGLLGNLAACYPIVWEVVKPMLFRFIIKKIKSVFSGKRTKERRDGDG